MRQGVTASLGSAAEVLDLTPYQILRFLGVKPKAPDAPSVAVDPARLSRLLGDH